MKHIFSKLLLPISWTIIIQVALCLPGSAIPSTDGFPIPYLDKYVHIVIFGVFVGLWCFYFSRKNFSSKRMSFIFFGIYLIAVINGIAIEYIQRDFIPNRSFDESDIIVDILSASIAYGICNVSLLNAQWKKFPEYKYKEPEPQAVGAD